MLAQVVFLGLVCSAVGLPGALLSQYHAQDELGQYTFGYSNPSSTKQETKTADGVTRGSYSYVDAFGRLQTRSYTADDLNGFRVTASDLPTQVSTLYSPGLPQLTYQPSRTSLISGARPLQQALQSSWSLPAYQSAGASKMTATKQQQQQQLSGSERPAAVDGAVRDTPEVAAAKAEHLAAVEQAKIRNAAAGGGDQSGDYYGDDSESIGTAYPAQFYNPSASFPVEHRYLSAIRNPYSPYFAEQGAVLGHGLGQGLGQGQQAVLPLGLSSQYHAQDEAGQYSFGYANDIASKSETKTLDGVTRGSFSYLDPYGLIQTRSYVADDDGFRVVASDLPQVRI